MARKRMIDPRIWEDEDFGRMSLIAKLLFIGIFSNADDEGRCHGSATYLKRAVFGYDGTTPEQVDAALDEIQGAMRSVVVYESGSKRYISLSQWAEYQTINRPKPSALPPPPLTESLIDHGIITDASDNAHGTEPSLSDADHGSITPKGKERNRSERKRKEPSLRSGGDARERAPEPPAAVPPAVARSSPALDRRAIPDGADAIYAVVLDVCGLDLSCSDPLWRDVAKVVGSSLAKGRDAPAIRAHADWFAREHWRGKRGELPSPKDLLDTVVQFERGITTSTTGNGNGYKSSAERSAQNAAAIKRKISDLRGDRDARDGVRG